MLQRVRVLIVSRHLLSRLFKSCFVKEARTTNWRRNETIPLHPLFYKRWDLLVADEVHFM